MCCVMRQGHHVHAVIKLVVGVNIIFTASILILHSAINSTQSSHRTVTSNNNSIESSPTTNGSGYYVTLCTDRIYGPHRTGNHLFLLAAALYVARRTGRTLTMPAACRWSLDSMFKVDAVEDQEQEQEGRGSSKTRRLIVERFLDTSPPPCPCRLLMPPAGTPFLHGDDALDTEEGLAKIMVHSNVVFSSSTSQGDSRSSPQPPPPPSQQSPPSTSSPSPSPKSPQSPPRTVELCGLYQTYRYADLLGPYLRRILQFQPDVRDAAEHFLTESRPLSWAPGSYTRVGLHVRRGDFTRHDWRDIGLTVVDAVFVHRVVDYFAARYRRVQLVVATDDKYWISTVLKDKFRPLSTGSQTQSAVRQENKQSDVLLSESRTRRERNHGNQTQDDNGLLRQSIYQLHPPLNASGDIIGDAQFSVIFSSQSAAVDMAVIAACDAVVMSTGSFGWWAAWLANRSTTVYYSLWPRPGSHLNDIFNTTRYFPKRWIPMQ